MKFANPATKITSGLAALAFVFTCGSACAGGTIAANTPGGAGGLIQGLQAIPVSVPTILVVEIPKVASKVSSDPAVAAASTAAATYTLSPSGQHWNVTNLQMCIKYNNVGADKKQFSVNLRNNVAQLTKQVLDGTGKPNFLFATGEPVDDTKNSQYCVLLQHV